MNDLSTKYYIRMLRVLTLFIIIISMQSQKGYFQSELVAFI